MARHEIEFDDVQEKGLAYVTDQHNVTLVAKTPPEPEITVDEYLQFVFGSAANDWGKQAGVKEAEPIIEKLKEAIESKDEVKIQAARDIFGVVKGQELVGEVVASVK